MAAVGIECTRCGRAGSYRRDAGGAVRPRRGSAWLAHGAGLMHPTRRLLSAMRRAVHGLAREPTPPWPAQLRGRGRQVRG